MNESELEKLFTVQGTREKPITFVPNQGVRRCCDLGDPEGYVPTTERLPYSILADGRIVLGTKDDKQLADWLRLKNLHNAYVYRYGPDLSLVRDSDLAPDLGFRNGSLWPFKAGSPSKW